MFVPFAAVDVESDPGIRRKLVLAHRKFVTQRKCRVKIASMDPRNFVRRVLLAAKDREFANPMTIPLLPSAKADPLLWPFGGSRRARIRTSGIPKGIRRYSSQGN